MISRLERTALEWAYDARYLSPRRVPVQQAADRSVPRSIDDTVVLSPAAQRLLDQAQRLAKHAEMK